MEFAVEEEYQPPGDTTAERLEVLKTIEVLLRAQSKADRKELTVFICYGLVVNIRPGLHSAARSSSVFKDW